ncbi:MAG: hypothetical protein JWR67_209 [Mucilaginibacter sp.]|nr:hypothetical protein [Mucilaginibacter sp.]
MKKVLLVLLLAAGVCQLKAQNIFPVKPADTLTNNLYQKYFNNKIDTSVVRLPQQKFKSIQPGQLNNLVVINQAELYDHMPIVRLPVNSKMPVVKLHINSKMPVINPYTHQRLDSTRHVTTLVNPD